jgi:CheY-like chemotaxis protein
VAELGRHLPGRFRVDRDNPEEPRHTRDRPIVAFTAATQKADVDSLLAAGCVRALAKPVDPPALRRLLRELLG